MDPLMVRLAKGLSAFYQDKGRAMETTTVVVMTSLAGASLRTRPSAPTTDAGV